MRYYAYVSAVFSIWPGHSVIVYTHAQALIYTLYYNEYNIMRLCVCVHSMIVKYYVGSPLVVK